MAQIKLGGSGGGGSLAGLDYDISLSLNGPAPMTTITAVFANRGYAPLPSGALGVANQGAPTFGVDAATGTRIIGMASGAARINQIWSSGGAVCVPLNVRFPGSTTVPPFVLIRPLMQFTVTILARVASVRGTADIELGLTSSNGMLDMLGTDPGAFWVSKVALNGGRWTPQYRLVSAGAITTGTDSTISATPGEWHAFTLRFTQGATPLLEWIIDDIPRFTVSGSGAIFGVQGSNNGYTPGYGMNTPAGTDLHIADVRYQAREIG